MKMDAGATCERLLERVAEIEPVLRERADEGERLRRLADPVVEAMREAELFQMVVPRSLGGLEVEPLTLYRVVEAVSKSDGSAGWCLFINGSAPYSVSRLQGDAAERIHEDPSTIISGTVFPFGRAERVDGGYRVTGRWQYSSGCWHSTWHLAFCNVYEPGGDEPLPGSVEGLPALICVHVPRDQVRVVDTWHVSGLAATGSHDVEIDGAFVPDGFTWEVTPGAPPGARFSAPQYRFPFLAFFSWPMASVALGIAQSAVDHVRALAEKKTERLATNPLRDKPLFQVQLAQALAKVASARAWLHQNVEDTWDRVRAGEAIGPEARAEFLLAATHATRASVEAVEIAYTTGGGAANFRSSPLQRQLRDIHGVSQHIGTSPSQYETSGRMLLGLPPEVPIVLL